MVRIEDPYILVRVSKLFIDNDNLPGKTISFIEDHGDIYKVFFYKDQCRNGLYCLDLTKRLYDIVIKTYYVELVDLYDELKESVSESLSIKGDLEYDNLQVNYIEVSTVYYRKDKYMVNVYSIMENQRYYFIVTIDDKRLDEIKRNAIVIKRNNLINKIQNED